MKTVIWWVCVLTASLLAVILPARALELIGCGALGILGAMIADFINGDS